MTFLGFFILLITEVVLKIFPNLNVVAHLVLLAGWGSCPPRLAIFSFGIQSLVGDHTTAVVFFGINIIIEINKKCVITL